MDKIVYTLVTNGGGIDGLDFTDKGGKIIAVSFSKEALQHNKNKPWCSIKAEVIDTDQVRKQALAKLDMIDKLVLLEE